MNDEPDALAAITRDLEALQSERRRHFVPALVFALVVVVGALAGFGLRPDLLEQPPWQIGLQVAAWIVCLILFPAVGTGLWFPSPATRVVVAVGGVALATAAAIGVPASDETISASGGGPCWMVLSGCGVVLLGVGALSGAFEQRRARSSTFWIAAGLTLAALEVVTWVCPSTQTTHVVSMHFGPALAIVALATAAGLLLHRRTR